MNIPISEIMQKQLLSVPSGRSVRRTYCEGSASWSEEPLAADISANGKILIQHYTVYPGIEMSYNYFLVDSLSHRHLHMPTIMEVNHCRHGRIGWQMENNLYLYLGEGNISFHMKDKCANSVLSFPLNFYEGITFSIDFQKLKQDPPDILKTANIDLKRMYEKFGDTDKITAIPESNHNECIFQALYDLPQHLVIPYGKLKAQEFILFLSQLPTNETPSLHSCDTEQVKIVKDIHSFLITNVDKRYTIEYLSKKYLMNSSTLKATFKSVYGMPIASYMKQYRMNKAIAYLQEQNRSMAEIAAAVGYENQSKFTAAFKNVIGVPPTTYRKNIL